MAKVKHIRLHTTETGLTIYAYIIRRPSDPDSNLQIFDVTDGKFRETSVDPYLDLTEDTAAKGQYAVEESTIVWTDGFYEFLFYSQLAGAPAPATDDILAVTTNRIKVVNDTIYAVFQTTDLKTVVEDASIDITTNATTNATNVIAALGTIVTAPVEGIATGGSTTTLIDTTRVWEADYWKNATYGYTHAGKIYAGKITGNTATTLQFTATALAPVAGDAFTIHLIPNVTNVKWVNDTVQTGADWSALLTGIDTDTGNIATNTTAATTPVIYNISIAAADTQYSQVVPAGTKKFSISIKNGTIGETFRWAYTAGAVAAGVSFGIDQGFAVEVGNINFTGSIYIAASNICTAQLEVWS